MDDENIAIYTKGLVKYYGKKQALFGVDLKVRQGEIFGFLGPNGSGKTTTIRCMLDLIRPQAGEISILGINPQKDPVGVRSQVGYLPGELSLEQNLRVEKQLRYFIELRRNNVDWNYVKDLAQQLNLDLSIPIKNLSKGNKQKVGLIQALMHRPRLLLLDEPTSGLDPLIQQQVYSLLKDARQEGTTIFFSSHIISEVEILAQRVAIIRDGVIVEEVEPEQLINMAFRRIRVRFTEPSDLQRLSDTTGVKVLSAQDECTATLQVEGEMDSLIKYLAAFSVKDFEIERPSLEEIFLAFYKAGTDRNY